MSATASRSNGWKLQGLKFLAIAATLLAYVLLCGLLDGHAIVGPEALLDGKLAPWTNALPGLLLLLLLVALSRKLLLSLWLTLLAQSLLYGVNSLKVASLATPLTRQDFLLVGQIGGDSSLFMHYLPWGLAFTCGLLCAALLTLVLSCWEPPLLTARKHLRLPVAAITILILGTLIVGLSPWRAIYAKATFDYRPWESTSRNAKRAGLLGSLLLSSIYAPSEVGIEPDPSPGMALLDTEGPDIAARRAVPARQPLPDIVVVQSESFFDPAILNGYHAEDWVPNLRRLQKWGQHGNMHVPTFGGGTIRTEFEVLTGLPLQFFPHLDYPYLGLKDSRIAGLARVLKQNGYETLAIHANKRGFWNRDSVFRRMGFDHFIAIDDPAFHDATRRGFYTSDQDTTDVILDKLADGQTPKFIFAISMENHGPYRNIPIHKNLVKQRDAIPVPAGVDAVGARILRDYLLHQLDADEQLGRLADAMAERTRPSLLVFYGDHLPGLEDGYAAGFKNGLDATEQTVPYLLIRADQPHAAPAKDMPAWMLGSGILQAAGARPDDWFALLSALEPQLQRDHGQSDPQLTRQLASLANLRLQNRMPKTKTGD